MADFKIANMKLVAGHISGAGQALANPTGGIETVNRVGVGLYIITFSQGFNSAPTVVVTQYFPGGGDFTLTGGSTLDNAVVVAVNNKQVLIKTGDSAGKASDRDFGFMAIEQVGP